MTAGGLGFDPRNISPLARLRDQQKMNFLPIWIGIFDAASVAMVLQGVQPPRPMTHDLLKSVIDNNGGKVDRIIVSDIKEGTFVAVIELLRDGKKLSIDARPSDAIALAVRTEAPIFFAANVMMQAKLVNAEKAAEETK